MCTGVSKEPAVSIISGGDVGSRFLCNISTEVPKYLTIISQYTFIFILLAFS
jgi:hypothetical protein